MSFLSNGQLIFIHNGKDVRVLQKISTEYLKEESILEIRSLDEETIAILISSETSMSH